MSQLQSDKLNDKHLRLWGLPSAVIVWTFIQMPFLFPGNWGLFWKNCISNVLFTIALWEVSRRLIMVVRRRFPGVTNTRKRIVAHAGWILGLNIPAQAIHLWVNELWGTSPPPVLTLGKWALDVGMSLFFFIVIVTVYEVIYFFHQYKITHQKTEQLKKQQAQQRLDALKTRVNPHFLFNSLTTLSALIGEDVPKAERFVDELSKVYRYLLRAGRNHAVSLNEELQFAKSYAFLLESRFDAGAFSYEVKLGSNFKLPSNFDITISDISLPALSLQNSLDYLVRTQNLPLKIEVEVLEQHLQIACTNNPKALSFDASDNDWRQLAANGARAETSNGNLEIHIPFILKPKSA